MKIALLASTFLPRIGGAEIVVHNLARQFCARGHDARVITWWGQWKGIRGRVEYPVLPLLPRSYSDAARRRWQAGRGSTAFVGAQVAAMQRLVRFDVWNVHMAYPAGMLAVPALHRCRVPIVTTCHGDDIFLVPECHLTNIESPSILAGVTRSLELSSILTAISRSVRDRYLEMGLPPHKIHDVPNGVDFWRIRNMAVDGRAVRAKYGWPVDRPLILLVGRYHKQKGYEDIPGIARELGAAGLQCVWVVVGGGAATFARSVATVNQGYDLHAVDGISAGGKFNELPADGLIEIMKAADVLVLPSRFESFGLVLVEAMAAGLPVCTTNVTGCRDVVEHGNTGLLSSVGDTATMARHIARVLTDGTFRGELIRNGLAFAQGLDWNQIAYQYLGLYESLVQARTGRSAGKGPCATA